MIQRVFLSAIVVLACAGAWASEPGQPLDCSDMQFDVPGLTCRSLAQDSLNPNNDFFRRGSNLSIDNEGFHLIVRTDTSNGNCGVEIRRSRDGGQTYERLGFIPMRTYTCGVDCVRVRHDYNYALDDQSIFDPVNGRLFIPLESAFERCFPSPYPYDGVYWMAAIEGFTTLYELRQQYVPQEAKVGFRVPAMPEGMPAADYFDTYWGDLATVGNWSHVQGLQCGYPAISPSVGDYLTVPDTLPTPAPGHGYYYVTAATYQGQTRYGRKTTGGRLTGRDPALLPACTVEAKQ